MSVRQQALATAQVYMRRFYTKREMRMTNPYLVLSTAFYLACKMEECPQHIRIVVGEARQFWPGTSYPIMVYHSPNIVPQKPFRRIRRS
jgi:cyclin C